MLGGKAAGRGRCTRGAWARAAFSKSTPLAHGNALPAPSGSKWSLNQLMLMVARARSPPACTSRIRCRRWKTEAKGYLASRACPLPIAKVGRAGSRFAQAASRIVEFNITRGDYALPDTLLRLSPVARSPIRTGQQCNDLANGLYCTRHDINKLEQASKAREVRWRNHSVRGLHGLGVFGTSASGETGAQACNARGDTLCAARSSLMIDWPVCPPSAQLRPLQRSRLYAPRRSR